MPALTEQTTSRQFEEGRMDAMLGHEFSTRYRREDKKLEYKRGYQFGLKEKQEESLKDEVRQMSEEDLIKSRANIQRIKNLLG